MDEKVDGWRRWRGLKFVGVHPGVNQPLHAARRQNNGENKKRGSSVKHLEADAWKNKLAVAERGIKSRNAEIPLIQSWQLAAGSWQLATLGQFLEVYIVILIHCCDSKKQTPVLFTFDVCVCARVRVHTHIYTYMHRRSMYRNRHLLYFFRLSMYEKVCSRR